MTAQQKIELNSLSPYLAELAATMLQTATNRLELPRLTVHVDFAWVATVDVVALGGGK